MNMKAFITLPLYHNLGICNFFRAVHSGKPIHVYNADFPLTQSHLAAILKRYDFEIFYGVPYALKFLAETDEGIQLLKKLKIVMYGGSACPDTLGNFLVKIGVHLVGHYGATEVGQLMTSFRPSGDTAWNYVRETAKLSPFLWWRLCENNLYECIVLSGWPAKVATNLADGSYATKDLFEPHPTIQKAWKYIAHLDDTITLLNGEKFNPVMMEGAIRSHRAVTEAVIFRSNRPCLGVLIVPNIEGMSQSEFVGEVWPVVEAANQTAEAYARISMDMVQVLPHDCPFPRTDKGSVIRQVFYKEFANEIEKAYDAAATKHGVIETFIAAELEEHIRNILHKYVPLVENIDRTTDLFSLGVDSLQSLQIRMETLKTVDIRGKELGPNVVFEYPSIASLSAHLHCLRTGAGEQQSNLFEQMETLVSRYSCFEKMQKKHRITLTGATGSLDAHILAQLAERPDVEVVHCLGRAKTDDDAMRRVQSSLLDRKIYHVLSLAARRKISALTANLSDTRLGLDDATYTRVASSLSSIIHCAWSVNFNKSLTSFEKDCIAGVRHLVDLCLATSSPAPATFDFCSSVSTVAHCPDLHTPERLAEYNRAQGMGYAQSKCIAEHICMAAAEKTGVKARVLRVGQIVADTVHGVWNASEAIPLMMQSAITIGALPKLQESPSWTPVDVVAKAVTEISFSNAQSVIANVTSPKTFSWTDELLPALRDAGLKFEEIEPKEWVQRLRASNKDATANPPIKLIDFFASKYEKDSFEPARTYQTKIARSHSPSLHNSPVLNNDFVKTFVRQFQATAWSAQIPNARPRKQVIVFTGPCGSGKSTIAKHISSCIKAAFVEGDDLYTADAVTGMTTRIPSDDQTRIPWFNRIKQRALDTFTTLGYDRVLLACSALRKCYHDELRKISGNEIDIKFLDLQIEQKELVRRVRARKDYYIKHGMVEDQLAIWEGPQKGETDVIPIDAGWPIDAVLGEVKWLLCDYIHM